MCFSLCYFSWVKFSVDCYISSYHHFLVFCLEFLINGGFWRLLGGILGSDVWNAINDAYHYVFPIIWTVLSFLEYFRIVNMDIIFPFLQKMIGWLPTYAPNCEIEKILKSVQLLLLFAPLNVYKFWNMITTLYVKNTSWRRRRWRRGWLPASVLYWLSWICRYFCWPIYSCSKHFI